MSLSDRTRRLITLAALVSSLLVAGCGFHLAGSRPLPAALERVYIHSSLPYSVDEPPVETALRARLRRRGADVVGSPATARSVLRLTDLRERREVLSVGLDGKALEFKLTTTVTFSLTAAEELLIAPQKQAVSRDYSFRAEEVLAKEAEEERLLRFIQAELADLILLRIETRLAGRLDAAPVADAATTPGAEPAP